MPETHLAWISLGSNIDPEQNLPGAVTRIKGLGEIVRCSSVWQSKPVGFAHQPDFCNAAVQLRTTLAPDDLKQELLRIEHDLKRVRDPANPNGPRTIDLDIVLYDSAVLDKAGLKIPDPEIPSRPFLIVPLAELDPTYQHPVLLTPLKKLAEACPGTAELIQRQDIRLIEN